MNLTPVSRRAVLALVLAALAAAPLGAQSVLYTEMDGKFMAVRKAHVHQPYVTVNGKLTSAFGKRYVLQKTDEYLPEFVSIRDLDVHTHYLDAGGSAINN